MSQSQVLSIHRGCNQSRHARGSDDLRVRFTCSQLLSLNAKRLQSWRSRCPFTLTEFEDSSRSGLKLNCPEFSLTQCFRRWGPLERLHGCENVDAGTYRLWLKSKLFCVGQTLTQLDRTLFSHLQVLGPDTASRPIVSCKVIILSVCLLSKSLCSILPLVCLMNSTCMKVHDGSLCYQLLYNRQLGHCLPQMFFLSELDLQL